MVLGVLNSYVNSGLNVETIFPKNPAKFISKDGHHSILISDLLQKYAPEFTNGATGILSPLLPNGHLQTMFASAKSFSGIDQVFYKRLVVKYEHGGEGTLDFAIDREQNDSLEHTPESQKNLPTSYHSFFSPTDARLKSDDSKPLLIVLHGLAGGSAESYVRSLVSSITNKYNFEACVFNARGCSHSTITTPQLYNGGWTNDIRSCVKQLRSMYPNRKFYMVGYSLGASVLANYLGEEGDKSDIACAATVSVPWDLSASAHFINDTRMGHYIYSPALCKSLLRLTSRHLDELTTNEQFKEKYITQAHTIKSLSQFDDCFTGPMFGYKDGWEYYADASSYQRIPGIRTPLLALNALDDPITGGESIPDELFKDNPFTTLVKTTTGGHVAWFTDIYGSRWYTEPLCKFFQAFHTEVVSKEMKTSVEAAALPKNPCPDIKTTIKN